MTERETPENQQPKGPKIIGVIAPDMETYRQIMEALGLQPQGPLMARRSDGETEILNSSQPDSFSNESQDFNPKVTAVIAPDFSQLLKIVQKIAGREPYVNEISSYQLGNRGAEVSVWRPTKDS